MATVKSHTDIEQSKKLAKFLPIESADMGWNVFVDGSTRCLPIDDWDLSKNGKGGAEFIPCWSLSALFSALPKYIGSSVLRMDISENDFNLWFDELSGIVDGILPDITKDNPVDACVAMIIKLHERKML